MNVISKRKSAASLSVDVVWLCIFVSASWVKSEGQLADRVPIPESKGASRQSDTVHRTPIITS